MGQPIAARPSQIADEELFAALDLDRPELAEVRAAAEAGDFAAAAEAWAEYFAQREKPTAHFDRERWAPFIRAELPQLVGPILSQADAVAAGQFAHGPYSMPVNGRDISWLHNPTKDTNYVSMVGSQWFLEPLGRAYLLTGDEKHAETFAWIFDSWYEHRDEISTHQGGLGFEPIWRAYYPGIQSRILAQNYYCFARSPALTPELHVKIMKQLLGAAEWLHARNAEYHRGNQQVGAVHGAGMVGLMFPEFKNADAWVERCLTRMREHLRDDFFDDGGHKELCTQYHKTCLRDFGYVSLTAEANGRESLFDCEEAPRLEKAYNWLAILVMPTGETPALHSAVFATDYAIHLSIAARVFRRPDFLWLAQRFWNRGIAPSQKGSLALSVHLVTQRMSRESRGDLEPAPPDYRSIQVDCSGFSVHRTGWDENDRYLVFQHGWANTGHAYPGALHFCLEQNGELIAASPGSPRSYRHPAYGYCHSTASHNVVNIDGKSYRGKSGIAPGGRQELLLNNEELWYVKGYHEGYQEAFGATHHREIVSAKGGPLLIIDRIEGGTGHTAFWSWHTPLELTLEGKTAVLRGRRQYRLCPLEPEEITEVKTERHWMAVLPRDCQPEDCGKEVDVLRYAKPIGEDGVEFVVALIEGEGGLQSDGPGVYHIEQGDRTWTIDMAGRESDGVPGEWPAVR